MPRPRNQRLCAASSVRAASCGSGVQIGVGSATTPVLAVRLEAMRARLFTAENRKWWTLGAVAFGLFMIMLDNTIVNVALPTIQRSLRLEHNIDKLEWIVTGYAPTFGALMLTGGKLADLWGRRL